MDAETRRAALAHALLPTHARRLAEARAVIADWLAQTERPYIALSTGKDSTCVAELVWAVQPAVPGVYLDADCAFPESSEYLDRLTAAGRTIYRWPCQPFLDVLAAAGGPDAPGIEAATMRATVDEPVRELVAAHGYDGVAVGLRGRESRERALTIARRGLLFRNASRGGVWDCLPVGRWTDADVWAYLVSHGHDYNRAYDRMADRPLRDRRLSYWAGETNRRYGRWVWLRRHYPDLWARFVARFPEVARFT